jgi:benzoyl-CoA reductase/2-hydroxyglutaryl-CoA dehydratase subunit BcrC/BadD/HgdB
MLTFLIISLIISGIYAFFYNFYIILHIKVVFFYSVKAIYNFIKRARQLQQKHFCSHAKEIYDFIELYITLY